MYINLKYKIEDKDSNTTLGAITNLGFEAAMTLAYDKAISILEKNEESIISVILLAWSHNLLTDARRSSDPENAKIARQLSSFYRKLAHKIYYYQAKHDLIGPIPGFLQLVK